MRREIYLILTIACTCYIMLTCSSRMQRISAPFECTTFIVIRDFVFFLLSFGSHWWQWRRFSANCHFDFFTDVKFILCTQKNCKIGLFRRPTLNVALCFVIVPKCSIQELFCFINQSICLLKLRILYWKLIVLFTWILLNCFLCHPIISTKFCMIFKLFCCC